jgi:hypothetical protein
MGHRWVMVFYLQLVFGTVTVADLTTIANAIDAAWSANLKSQQASTTVMTNITIVFVPSVGNEVTYTGSYTETGTNAGTRIDDVSSTAVVQWKISAYYRGGHPRSYFAGLATTHVNNGSDLDATETTGLASSFTAFKTAINAITSANVTSVVMGTLSFASANAWRVTPIFRPFTSVSINPKLGSQRRRIHS